MRLAPWDYVFLSFNSSNFADLFYPTWILALIFLIVTIVLYNVRTRQLRHHEPYLTMYEWLLWTGLITFSLIIVYAVFVFDFFFVPLTLLIGLGTAVWVRFIKFPPQFNAYEARLAKQRYFSRTRFSKPEATIRTRPIRTRRSRRARR